MHRKVVLFGRFELTVLSDIWYHILFNDDWVRSQYSRQQFPANGAIDGFSDSKACWGQLDEILMAEVGNYSDDEDDFGQFDEEGVGIALFGLNRIDELVVNIWQLLKKRFKVNMQFL